MKVREKNIYMNYCIKSNLCKAVLVVFICFDTLAYP